MRSPEQIRNKYVKLNGVRAVDGRFLEALRENPNIKPPAEFIEALDFFDGSGLSALPLHPIDSSIPTNTLSETLRLRQGIDLPPQFLVLGEPSESLLLLDCTDGSVLWCNAIDAPRLGKEPLKTAPERWENFLSFLDYLIQEEEADRQ